MMEMFIFLRVLHTFVYKLQGIYPKSSTSNIKCNKGSSYASQMSKVPVMVVFRVFSCFLGVTRWEQRNKVTRMGGRQVQDPMEILTSFLPLTVVLWKLERRGFEGECPPLTPPCISRSCKIIYSNRYALVYCGK